MTNKKLFTASIIAGIAALFAIPTGISYGGVVCDNFISGTVGNDNLTGTPDADCVDAFAGNDRIQTGDGADIVDAGAGADRVTTGNADDLIYLGHDGVVDRVMCGEGNDTVVGADANDILRGCENVS